MLIEELLGYSIAEDDFAGDAEIQNALGDILVQLRQRSIRSVGLDDLAGELGKAVDGVQVDPTDPGFLELLRAALEKSQWVDAISPTGEVVLKQPGQDDKESDKERDQEDRKMAGLGAKSLKRKSDAGEL